MDETKKITTDIDTKKPKKNNFVKILFLTLLASFIIVLVIIRGIVSYFAGDSSNSDPIIPPELEKALEVTPTPKATSSLSPSSTKKQTQTVSPTANVDARKEKIINFFVELANFDDSDKSLELALMRWTKSSVAVGVAEGTFDATLNTCLNNYLSDFNGLSTNVKLVRDDRVDLGLPNVKIYYWPDAQFKERGGPTANSGYVEWILNDDHSIKRSIMFLSESIMNMDEVVRCQLIRHEMTHAIGVWGHSSVFPESIMSLPKSRYLYPEEDKILIKMLYNSGVPLGIKSAETRTFFNSNFNY